LVAGHYQPLADNVAIAATSDQTCLPQSTQKASEGDSCRIRFASIAEDQSRAAAEATVLFLHLTTQKSSGYARDFCSNQLLERLSAS